MISFTLSWTLRAYADADGAVDISDRKSTSGFLCFSRWFSCLLGKARNNLLLFALLLKYHAMASATSEIVYLRWLLSDMGAIVIIRVPFRLHTIRSFMRVQSISKLIVILFVTISSQAYWPIVCSILSSVAWLLHKDSYCCLLPFSSSSNSSMLFTLASWVWGGCW